MERQSSLTLVPVGGLANRMRAIVSGWWLSHQTDSRLRVVWFADEALGARFADCFRPLDSSLMDLREAGWTDGLVDGRPRLRNLWLPRLVQRLVYDGRIEGRDVTPLKNRDFDFARWLRGRRCYMSCYQEFGDAPTALYRRFFRPVEEVECQVEANVGRFSPYTIGMHIRRGDHTEAAAKSPLEGFIDAGRKELASHPDLAIFLATDSEDVKAAMRREFPDRIITSSTPASRGSVDGIRGGLADMYTLSHTRRIYGSALSTFSVMAERLRPETEEGVEKLWLPQG